MAGQLHDALSVVQKCHRSGEGHLDGRLHLTPEDAFDTLRRGSQRLNLKFESWPNGLPRPGEYDDFGPEGSARQPDNA